MFLTNCHRCGMKNSPLIHDLHSRRLDRLDRLILHPAEKCGPLFGVEATRQFDRWNYSPERRSTHRKYEIQRRQAGPPILVLECARFTIVG